MPTETVEIALAEGEAPAPEPELSVADHATQFGPGAAAIETDSEPVEADAGNAPEPRTHHAQEQARDRAGKFNPRGRHRAASQQGSPEDVDTINALTKRLREAEEADGADIVRKDGESERVFKLRRSVEIAERRRAQSSQPPQAASPAPAAPSRPAASTARPAATQAAAGADPEPDPADATKYPDGVYDPKYIRDNARWAAREEHREIRRTEAQEREEREIATTFEARATAAAAKYPDFDAVVFGNKNPLGWERGDPIDLFIMNDDAGHDVLYHLIKNRSDLQGILQKSPHGQYVALSLLAQRL